MLTSHLVQFKQPNKIIPKGISAKQLVLYYVCYYLWRSYYGLKTSLIVITTSHEHTVIKLYITIIACFSFTIPHLSHLSIKIDHKGMFANSTYFLF
jgi:hypothetical protein